MSTKVSAIRRIGYFIQSFIFWIYLIVTTFLISWMVVIHAPAPFKYRYAWGRRWGKVSLFGMKHICGLDYEIKGLDQLTDASAIIFSKHQSAFECFVFLADFPTVAWVLKRELLWIPIFGWALALIRPTAIDRRSGSVAVEQVVNQGRKSLDDGRWVVIFPEGTRTAPGTKPRYKMGGGLLAERTGYPVYPVALNSGEFWPKHSFIKWPGKITFEVGPKILTENKKPAEIMKEAQTWIESTVDRISDPARWDR